MNDNEIAQLDDENQQRSLRRTQKELQELIECNDFDWFGTLTFDPNKIDRHDEKAVKSAMKNWLNNQRKHSPEMTYILVPERHKDGAIHFHALMGNYNGKMQYSGSEWHKQPIFNVLSYPWGFTNFTKIRDKAKTANYCRKYITKDMATSDKNEKRYWRSKNLAKPNKEFNKLPYDYLTSPHLDIDINALSRYDNDFVEITNFPLNSQNPHFTP